MLAPAEAGDEDFSKCHQRNPYAEERLKARLEARRAPTHPGRTETRRRPLGVAQKRICGPNSTESLV